MSRAHILTRTLCLASAALWLGCSDVDLGGGDGPPVPEGPSQWTMLGGDYASTYHNRVEDKITRETVGSLKLHWAFEPVSQPNGTPVVVDGVVYATSNGGSYAIDADTGEMLWENLDLPASSSFAYYDGTLYVHTRRAMVTAVDPATGDILWESPSDDHRVATGYSSPIVVDDIVLVGASSNEEGAVAEGATFRGGVVAFDRHSGERLWRHYTAVPPYNGSTVWSTVTVDLEARHVFGTTGNNYTGEGGPNSDSIFALDLDTGALVWTTQLTEDDVFTILNPKSPDSDFGTNPTLYDVEIDGVTRKMLAAGQKSGVMWGLDRETGEVVWENPLTSGSALIGGVLNTGAYDGERLLVVSHDDRRREQAILFALDPATGAIQWQTMVADWVWGPITVTNGVAFVSTWTQLRAYDTDNGNELFVFETAGTIASGAAIADGRVYFGSGMAYIVGEPESRVYALSLPGDEPPTPEPTATPRPADSTFTSIYDDIFVAEGCAGQSCHGGGAGMLSFASQQEAYDGLVDVQAMGAACADQGGVRVVPGDAGASLLMDKVANAEPSCGDVMPIAGMLDPDQIDRIEAWILAGAPND